MRQPFVVLVFFLLGIFSVQGRTNAGRITKTFWSQDPTRLGQRSKTIQSSSFSRKHKGTLSSLASLWKSTIPRGGAAPPLPTPPVFDGEVTGLVDDAYGWCMNLGQPSALVAGAVIATIYENIGSGSLDILPEDSKWTKLKKRVTTSLLLSAFGLEVIAIFVTTVTGTMLLSRPLHEMDHLVPVQEHTTPLQFLRENFEFEYLTARISFLQGLLNWLAAIALSHIIPRETETQETRIMNRFISSALFSMIAIMLAFYNKHMSFHRNYFEMLSHWVKFTAHKYLWTNPLKSPMALVYFPCIFSTLYWGYRGFIKSEKEQNQMNNMANSDNNKASQKDNDKKKR